MMTKEPYASETTMVKPVHGQVSPEHTFPVMAGNSLIGLPTKEFISSSFIMHAHCNFFSLFGLVSFFEHQSENGIENYAWRKEGMPYYPAYPPTYNVPAQSSFHPTEFGSIRFVTVRNIGDDLQARDVNMYWENQNSTKNDKGQAAAIIPRKSAATKTQRYDTDLSYDRLYSQDISPELSFKICNQVTASEPQTRSASATTATPWQVMRKEIPGHDADNSACQWNTANFVDPPGDRQHQACPDPPAPFPSDRGFFQARLSVPDDCRRRIWTESLSEALH
jgi:hypothetical protein